jgi:hypothetical protein
MQVSPSNKTRRTWLLASVVGATGLGCAVDDARPFDSSLADEISRIDAVGVCETSSVAGLSQQLVDVQMSCVSGGAFVPFDSHPNIVIAGGNVFPYMQASARDALWAAADQHTLHVTSAFRTIAQQYVLYHSNACPAAAPPGGSNHQSGIAVDLANWDSVVGVMGQAGCTHPHANDPVHFDCAGEDRRSDSVRAFQILWNANNPTDQIEVDGIYGAGTEARLEAAPAQGFATLGDCAPPSGTEPAARRSDVYAISRHGASESTEVHVLDAASGFSSFRLSAASALHPTDSDVFDFGVGDFDGDAHDDVYVILRNGSSGTTEVHVLDAAGEFTDFLLHAATALHPTEGELFDFGVGDFDGDGRDDVYMILRRGTSGATEVHVLDAASDFSTFLVHAATALHATEGELFDFAVGDYDGNGRDDLYAIVREGGSGTTEVHVLDAATDFSRFLLQTGTALQSTADPVFELEAGDFDGDRRDDLYLIVRNGSSGMTEVHVLGAASDFSELLIQTATALHSIEGELFELGVGAF